ncbi:hypothetical protein [Limobrevibacterium gyesilva]|uniref:Uncharacterized protein n=1 Tax=Limobrevibacterium gyesilva TaxID=2991712 RepID=A0AA41YP70_9PROT|nr:hypothetical protein [Limobrevibacterium gyesilva]MCW3473965.1 hypothetical protein [Limobrevibacterium gyesilva]
MPTTDEFNLLRMLGLLTLALVFGPRVIPPLQPYANRIGVAALVLYVVFGLGFLAWRMFMA